MTKNSGGVVRPMKNILVYLALEIIFLNIDCRHTIESLHEQTSYDSNNFIGADRLIKAGMSVRGAKFLIYSHQYS
jgi:hypothetical protein